MANEYIFYWYLSDGTLFKVVRCSNLLQYIKVSQPQKWGILDSLTVKITTLIVAFFNYGKVEKKLISDCKSGVYTIITNEINYAFR